MTNSTHKQYAISYAYIAAMLMYCYNMTEVNYYLALPIIMLVAKCGGNFPDLDHSWSNIKDKTILKLIINKIIHLTGGKHRSWQTHSLDITCVATITSYMIPKILLEKGVISIINKEILGILMISFSAGWISHLVADMLTSKGVRVFCWSKKLKFRLVPKKIGKLSFNTGNEWEAYIYRTTKVINGVLCVICLVLPIFIELNILNLIFGGK